MIRNWLKNLRRQFGTKSATSVLLIVATFFTDWFSRFQSWQTVILASVHKPWFPLVSRLIIIAIGVCVIVSDYRAHLKVKRHNLTSTKAEMVNILYHDDHGYFTRTVDPPRSRLAILLEVINVADPKRRIESSGKIRAQLTFRLADGWKRIFTPGTWVSQFFSWVDIGPGDTRELIIAMCSDTQEYIRNWSAVINRRDNEKDAISVDFQQDILTHAEGTVTIDLISCESGGIVASFELGFGMSLSTLSQEIKYVKQLS
jgi:hypothetical protein